MSRVLTVSNRLPVEVKLDGGRVALATTIGGLATALGGVDPGPWVGWPGDVSRLDAAQQRDLDGLLAAGGYRPVHLTPGEIARYYEGYANGVLWPLLHSMPDRMPLASRDWGAYVDVNTKFAEAVAREHRPGDVVWIHDYHLLLLPALLRARLPTARVGLFLHVPFPPSDTFRVLPHRRELLEGMLGADLVGFQTHADQGHFLSAVLRLLGIEADIDRLEWDGRRVDVEAHPIGVDFDAFDRAEPRSSPADVRGAGPLLLGVDRLDYTKGIPRRLLALDRLLERHPRWRGRVRLLQIAVPSREGVGAYRELRRQVDELVGRINGEWSTYRWAPIRLLHRGFPRSEVVELYRAADVMVVTPLRDGMNLVAKEFVAARRDEDGALVLSEFAGAAAELGEAVIVNPHDLDACADGLDRALSMPASERRRRMRALRSRVRQSGATEWAAGFVRRVVEREEAATALDLGPADEDALVDELASGDLVVLLDHDGTLVDLAPDPEDARPDAAVLELVASLAATAAVHVVSGRDAATLARWYGALAIHLHAEHGASSRAPAGGWVDRIEVATGWRAAVLERMRTFAARTSGAWVEEKAVGVAWHYRAADAELGAGMARELRHHLRALLANAPLEVVAGRKVVEVRPVGAHKGRVVPDALAAAGAGARALALGDDRTDLDLFDALPPGAVAIAVGGRVGRATWRVADPAAARRLLGRIAAARRGALARDQWTPPRPSSSCAVCGASTTRSTPRRSG